MYAFKPGPCRIDRVDSELVRRGPTRDAICIPWLVVPVLASVALWLLGAIVAGAVAELLGW